MTPNFQQALRATALAVATLVGGAALAAPVQSRNIVIVPDAFVDGSSWHVVHDILSSKGYRVSVVPAPHTSLEDDIAITRRILFQQVGKVVLVGHGIGGSVISHAGNGDKVRALVYVAALAPEVGENALQLIRAVPAEGSSMKPDFSGFYWTERARWHADLGADLSANRANFFAASQVPLSQVFLGTPGYAAVWHNKPTYAIVATQDRFLSPETQQMMYQRAHARVSELDGSHAVPASRPEDVAKVIEQAAIDTF